MIKRQTVTALICGVVAIALAIVYFAVVAPTLVAEEEKVTPIELIDPLEVRTYNQTEVYMFPQLESARIEKIEVHNESGGYTFYKASNDQFRIEGMENAPYDYMALAYLVTGTGAGIASERYYPVKEEDLSQYGLDNPKTYFTITDDDKNSHTVFIGNKAPSGDGYYCQYKDRPAVYLIRTPYSVLFSDVYGLMTPTLGLPVSETAYSDVTLFGVVKNGVPLFEIKTVSPEENGSASTSKPTYSYEFTFSSLKNFTPNETRRDHVLSLLSGLSGNKVVAYGNEITVESLKTDYGIDLEKPYYRIYYKYTSNADIFLSAPDKEGMCYAYSTVYNTVVTMPISSMEMVNLDVYDFIMPNLTLTSITLVNKIEIKGSLPDEGIDVDSAYGIKTTYIEGTEQSVQSVWNVNTNKQFTTDEVANFKQIYGDILNLHIAGDVDMSNITESEHIASITISYTDGTAKKFDFYAYNSTRCYYTVNGVLNENYPFYVSRDNVERVIRDTYRFDLGYTLDSAI